jgi:hypothetical protein
MPSAPSTTPAVGPEDFAALVAELRAELAVATRLKRQALLNGAETPACFTGRPWVHATVYLSDAVPLTGYSHKTLEQYATPGGKVHQPWGKFPPPVTEGRSGQSRRWRISDLALWAAPRDPSKGKPVLTDEQVADALARIEAGESPSKAAARYGLTYWGIRKYRNPGREDQTRNLSGRTGRTGFPPEVAFTPSGKPRKPPKQPRRVKCSEPRRRAALAFVTSLVVADPAITWPQVKTAAREAGVHLGVSTRVWDEARARALPAVIAEAVSARPDGLLSPAAAGAAFGISRHRVAAAVKRGEIHAIRDRKYSLIDPARLRFRHTKPGRRTPAAPVDRDHPLAIPLPGDEKEAMPHAQEHSRP